MDVRVTLGPDATLDFGCVYVYYVCSGYRILQETFGGKAYGYAILGRLLEDVRKGPLLGECTRYLGSGDKGDLVWMDIP